MGMTPRVERLGTGKYRVHSGDEYVNVLAVYYRKTWLAQPKGHAERISFRTKRDAVNWAHDWLAEYA